MARKAASFLLTGEGLTSRVRDLMLSEQLSTAWRVLTEGLIGEGVEKIAIPVLEGKLKFIGDSNRGLEVVEDDDKDYQVKLAQVFAGRIKLDGLWYRPRAEMAGCTKYAVTRETLDGERFFAVPKTTKGPGSRYVIFEPCSEPPMWWVELRTPRDAADQWVEANGPLPEPYPDHSPTEEMLEKEEFRKSMRIGEFCEPIQPEEDGTLSDRERERLDIAERVREQAGADRMDLTLKDGKVISVAAAPFINWALRLTSLQGLAPHWDPISPSGMKMQNDCRFHSDWVIEAGLDFEEVYSGPVHDAALDAMFKLQEQYGEFECAVLVTAPTVIGRIGTDVVVLSDLHPDNLSKVLAAKAVITQAGGKLAHLSVIALEKRIPIVRVPDALSRFQPGTIVRVDSSRGQVHPALLPA